MEEILTQLVINCETGEETIVPLTQEEIAFREQQKLEFEQQLIELEAKEKAKAEAKASALAKLAALGLTEEEVTAII